MGRLSDKIKIIYLILVILFSLGVFFYLLDTWGVIRLEETLTFLKDEPPVVPEDRDSITALEREKLEKRERELDDRELKIDSRAEDLKEREATLKRKEEELAAVRDGLDKQKQETAREVEAQRKRELLIRANAQRLVAMPPQDARDIVNNWSNPDVVDVFRQMERDAEVEGRQSIVPYLLTLLPRERASTLTTLMMDANADNLPEKN